MNKKPLFVFALLIGIPLALSAKDMPLGEIIDKQRKNLAENTKDAGFGPQSPRDIDSVVGENPVIFAVAPDSSQMNLCNIHFHKSAEHKGGQFTKPVSQFDRLGYYNGYLYSGQLTKTEKTPINKAVCAGKHGGLNSGDTIELHYVYSSAQVSPGPTLGACLNESIGNPQLRVETQVYVLVNDKEAADFMALTKHGEKEGYHQALNIPDSTGEPVQYAGSTTGPSHNEKGSPLQVTWSVRPEVKKVHVESVGQWCEDNVFNEAYAQGVRNLVTNPALLSEIK